MAKPKPFPDLTSEVVLGFSASADGDRPERLIIGVDEVGRGCLAGPVVAAAAILPADVMLRLPFEAHGTRMGKRDSKKILKNFSNSDHGNLLWEVCDSKLVAEEDRAPMAEVVKGFVRGYAVAEASVPEINELNILYASHLAMQRAVEQLEARLGRQADVIIVDGHIVPKCFVPRGMGRAIALIKGDQKSFTIACASIIAKVYRDLLMAELDTEFPGYGLRQHKGYGTPFHKSRIAELGVTPLHRAHFKGVRQDDEAEEVFEGFDSEESL